MTYTELEMKVYNLAAAISMSGSVTVMEDIVTLGITAKVARGVIASLVKKDMMTVDLYKNLGEPDEMHYWPTTRIWKDSWVSSTGEKIESPLAGSFWCDNLTDEEYEAELIKPEEVK
jgi:hypothetical protein